MAKGSLAKASLILATAIDLAIAGLLVWVSGFLFGTGSEALRTSGPVAVVYAAGIIACIVAPIAGFTLNGIGRTLPAQFVTWLPVVGALAAVIAPAPY